MRNTLDSWGAPSKALHWAIAILIAIEVPVGFWMTHTLIVLTETGEGETLQFWLQVVHQSIGFIVLILVALRLGWRLSNPTPALPAALERYQRFLARANHAFLYALLLIFPLSGWAALSTLIGNPDWDEGIHFVKLGIPGLVPPETDGDYSAYRLFAIIHRGCWQVGGFILALHLVAAAWHEIVQKDGTLARMLPDGLAKPLR